MFYWVFIIILTPTILFAGEYTFEWDDNQEPDISRYRLYWRSPSDNEEWNCRVEMPDKFCTGPTEGFKKENSQDTPGRVTTIKLPKPSNDRCYAVTAIDTADFESDFSNQICVRKMAWTIRR